MKRQIDIQTEVEMLDLGIALASAIQQHHTTSLMLYLEGQLGAGKTTLARGLLRGLGYQGRVKSPSYGLVEPYQLQGLELYHIDLYRLQDPREIHYLGLSDYLTSNAICIIEWPEKGRPYLPRASLYCTIEVLPVGRRTCHFAAQDAVGEALLKTLELS